MNGKSILEVIHSTVKGMHDCGTISDTTMREFDVSCLPETDRLLQEACELLRRTTKIDFLEYDEINTFLNKIDNIS